MHDFSQRGKRTTRVIPITKIRHSALHDALRDTGIQGLDFANVIPVVFNAVERRNIHPGDLRKCLQNRQTGTFGTTLSLPFSNNFSDLTDHFLAFTEYRDINKIGHGFGVEGGMTTDHH